MKGISQDEQNPRNQRSPWKYPARFKDTQKHMAMDQYLYIPFLGG
jgi:hypothetical protein